MNWAGRQVRALTCSLNVLALAPQAHSNGSAEGTRVGRGPAGGDMNRALARDLAITALRASTQLSSLLPDLKEQCDPTEYARLSRSIASVCGHIVNEISRRYSMSIQT